MRALDRRAINSRRRAGGVTIEVDIDIVALQHHFIGAQRDLAGRRFDLSGLHVEGAEMHAAFDDVAFQEAVGEARRGMGAFVVGDVELALDIVHREPAVADLEGLHRFRRDVGLRTNPNDVFRHGPPLSAPVI